ncbi:sodium/proton-translocating pyrophosphatase [Brucella abortus]|nr:sodium/proton-translocating pyrophosphatase [Brucella abortus]
MPSPWLRRWFWERSSSAVPDALTNVMLYPLMICGACVITSIAGTFFVKLGVNGSIMGALYKGLIATGLLSIVGLGVANTLTVGWGEIGTVAGKGITGTNLFVCGLIGLIVTGLIVVITECVCRHQQTPGQFHRASLGDGPRHQCHSGACGFARNPPPCLPS